MESSTDIKGDSRAPFRRKVSFAVCGQIYPSYPDQYLRVDSFSSDAIEMKLVSGLLERLYGCSVLE